MPRTNVASLAYDLTPADAEQSTAEFRTLWECTVHVPGGVEQDFMFRSGEDFRDASVTAHELVENSPACRMVSAVIVNLKRLALLWN